MRYGYLARSIPMTYIELFDRLTGIMVSAFAKGLSEQENEMQMMQSALDKFDRGEEITFNIVAQTVKRAKIKCDCGGASVATTHSDWCSLKQ